MTDLALALHDLPPHVVRAILDVLDDAYATGEATCGAVAFHLKGHAVGEITVSDTEANLTATVTALDAEGHETTFDAAPTWESSDDSVATCSPSADGYSCAFSIGAPGSAVITCTGIENSSGTDVEIISVGTITVTAGDAVVGSIEFEVGTPE